MFYMNKGERRLTLVNTGPIAFINAVLSFAKFLTCPAVAESLHSGGGAG
jgi:hypothetical protein